MECKKCGIDLSGKEYRNVAKWFFCLECFQNLLDKAEEKKDDPAEMPATATAGERLRCLVCEREIEKGTGCEMLGMTFCRECYENLVKKPAIPLRTEAGETEPMSPSEKPAVMQVRVDLTSPVQCYSCGRQVPAMGSKQFDGHPYCPDCYCRLPEIQTQKPKPFSTVVGATPEKTEEPEESDACTEKHEGGRMCQACQRQVFSSNLKTVEGFEICLACLTTDRDTALEIARARHRKALEKIRKELA